MIRIIIVATLLIFSAVSQPAIASNCDKHSMSIAGQAASAGNFNTLLAAAKATNLTNSLYNDGQFTIFAPTDEAFAKLSKCTPTTMLTQKVNTLSNNLFSDSLTRAES